MDFKLVTSFVPMGDQPRSIEQLVSSLEKGSSRLLLKGATGTGKTFTIANVIERLNRQTLILVHNKTLAAQIWSELSDLFPNNAVEYFISYYDYYQPEAYLAHKDLFIEKDGKINREIERMRHSVMGSLLERNDVIVVASISCLYPMSAPEEFAKASFVLSSQGAVLYSRQEVLQCLLTCRYTRNDIEFLPGCFRVRGGVIDIYPPSYHNQAVRVQFFGDDLEELLLIDTVTEEVIRKLEHVHIFSANPFVTNNEQIKNAIPKILAELEERSKELRDNNQEVEAYRLEARTKYDLEMLETTGHCSGIENYSAFMQNREEGTRCFNLIDYFAKDFITVVDESHVAMPQLRTMVPSDSSRKNSLINYGYRLPSVLDNRPLTFDEFEALIPRLIYMSATPSDYEINISEIQVDQLIRPTGVLDPVVELRPQEGGYTDMLVHIRQTIARNERVLITVLTKIQAEEMALKLTEEKINARYLHAEIVTVERIEILNDLRAGICDVVIGVNLLREGLDLPEVSLVVVLDADRSGFLRSTKSLLQIIGRAARNINGRVLFYASQVTPAMKEAMEETSHRRDVQHAFNEEYGLKPRTTVKVIKESLKPLLEKYKD